MELPTERPPVPTAAAARRVLFGFGLRDLGAAAVAIAALTLAAVWHHRQAQANEADRSALRSQIALRADAAEVYREQFAALKAESARFRVVADQATTEPARSWARERARRFDTLVAALDREADAYAFDSAARQAADALRHDDLATAQARMANAPSPVFPPLSEFERLRQQLYEVPLVQFSRQSPGLYRAFRQFEPDLAKSDETTLRNEITTAGSQDATPQTILKVDLLAAVASTDDPLVAEWSARAGAMDYFENPDGATIAAWRKAQAAVRDNDWATASAEMLAISKTTVRTRQAFRAAFGRALLKSRPDDPTQAYPWLAEAAAAGDKQARAWVADEDLRQKRYGDAQRWMEASARDGDSGAVAALLALYEKHGTAISPDLNRRVAVLERVTQGAESNADALVALGRLYERGDPPGSKAKAVAAYRRAASQGSAAGSLELARCALRGVGMPSNLDQACDAAEDAFKRGEREGAAAILGELMRVAPDATAASIAQLVGTASVAAPSPFLRTSIIDGPGVTALKAQLARYFDHHGDLARAAQFYTGLHDAAAQRRHGELTAAHPCDTCGGTGKILDSVDCPTCGGTGKQLCSFCGGTGFIFVPGSPPCTTCGGSGTMVQDRRVVTCAACGGTGKGKGSVIKQDCTHCEHGYIRCAECVDGKVRVSKECPDCHGKGTWTLVDRAEN